MDIGNGGRRGHTAWSVETSGEGWKVVGVGDGEADDAPLQEMRWRSGVDIDDKTMNSCW